MSKSNYKHEGHDTLYRSFKVGDKMLCVYRGWKGRLFKPYTGTVMRITDYGAWIKPDPNYEMYGQYHGTWDSWKYDPVTRRHSKVNERLYEHNGWRFHYRVTLMGKI